MTEEQPPKWVLDFLREFYTIWDELVELLDIDLSGDREPNPLEIRLAKRHRETLELAQRVDIRAGFRFPLLGILANNLRILKQKHPAIYSAFKNEFHQFDRDQYFGWRCEVDTAGFLARNDVKFTHPDPPDFRIHGYSEPVSIECTAARYTSSQFDIEEKIKDKVSDKSDRNSYTPSTALIIDVTNVYNTSLRRDREFNSPELKEAVRERFDIFDLDIGSVLLLAYIGDIEEGVVTHATDRVDNSPSDGLADFLDDHFPFGEGTKKLRYFSPEP